MNYTFHKHERLCSRKQIDLLFKTSQSFSAFPIKLVFMPVAQGLPAPAQAMFVVPKRLFKRAHDRNLLKRRLREAYRLNKPAFYQSLQGTQKQLLLAFIYTGKSSEDFVIIQNALTKVLERALNKVVKTA